MNILGISAFYHDSAACLVQDGKIISAAQEERFTRKKHDFSFPKNAITYCLQNSGLTGHDLDFVAFYDKPFIKFERILETYLAYAPIGIGSFIKAMPLWIKHKIWMRGKLSLRSITSHMPPLPFSRLHFRKRRSLPSMGLVNGQRQAMARG